MRDKALGSLERARSSAGNAEVCLLKRRARDPKEDEKEERFCFCAFARVRAPVWKKMKNSKKPSKTLSLSLSPWRYARPSAICVPHLAASSCE